VESKALGRHLLVEYTNCDATLLANQEHVQRVMLEAALATGAEVVAHSFHHFSPYGVSGAVIISESHLAIHTWPEYRFAAVDLFTCGDQVDPWAAFDHLKVALGAEEGSALEILRGQLRIPGLRHKPGAD
jgi:S-adenosylmethionine decarboxylase proenzyme